MDEVLCVLVIIFLILAAFILANMMGVSIPKFPKLIKGGTSDKLQKAAFTKYPQYRASIKKPSFEEFCFPKGIFNVQKPQAFAGEYMSPKNNNKALLVFHKIGAGKTCLSIQIAERWMQKGKPLMLMPASLIPGFRNELRGNCAGFKYISDSDGKLLKTLDPQSKQYKKVIEVSDKLIDSRYQIYSYNKFTTDYARLKAPIIIIDEVQNINSIGGVYFNSILNFTEKHSDIPVVIMSGTPLFDNVNELVGLMRLMRIEVDELPAIDKIPKLLDGKVTYYEGAPDYTFPSTTIHIKKCEMSPFQTKWFRSEVESEKKEDRIKTREVSNNFYVKSRQRANIAYPNGLVGESGMAALIPSIIKNSLKTYSCKFPKIIKKLNQGKLSFVYTGFKGHGGIAALTKILDVYGYKDFNKQCAGHKRYAVWSGDQTQHSKDVMRAVFNSSKNDDASQLQVIIGSPSIKEGVTLTRVRNVMIIEPYWNHSRLEQIYGRAVRYCSHKILPKADRHVDIYIYVARAHKSAKNSIEPEDSIDAYMLDLADQKKEENAPYVKALASVAVDKMLNRY